MRSRRGTRTRRGFTLIESIVTVLVVTIGSIGALSLATWVRMQNDLEQERARAHQIVCQEMERIRHELYTRITGGTTVTVWDNGSPENADDDTFGTLEVVVRHPNGTILAAAPKPAVRVQVEVTLSWNPRGRLGGSKTFRETVMTYIAP